MLALFIFPILNGGCGQHNRRAPTKKDVPILIAKLNHRNWKVRLKAANELGYLGVDAEEAIPFLVEALLDTHWEVRRAAVHALYSFTKEPMVARSLGARLKDQNVAVRRAAIEVLASEGSLSSAVLPEIIEALKDEDEQVRWQAVFALEAIKPDPAEVVKPVIEILNSSNKDARIAAIRVLGRIGPDPEAVSSLLVTLVDEDIEIRDAAIGALGEIGPVPGVVQALIGTLTGEVPRLKEHILKILGKFGPASKDAVGVLIELAKEGEGEVPKLAVETLGDIGPDVADALPFLMNALIDKVIPFEPVSTAIQKIAYKGLREIIVEGLSSDDPSIRATSVNVLLNIPRNLFGNYWVKDTLRRELGNRYIDVRYPIALDKAREGLSEGVVKAFVQRLADDDPSVRKETYAALNEIGPAKLGPLLLVIQTPGKGAVHEAPDKATVVPEPLTTAKLVGLLRHDDSEVRWAAARILGFLNADLSGSITTLAELMKDGKLELRQWSVNKLIEIQIGIDKVLPVLSNGLKKGGSDERYWAITKLSETSQEITKALPTVVEALGDDNLFVSQRAMSIIKRYNAEAMPYLIEACKGDDANIRGGVAEYSSYTDRDVKGLAPALIGMLDDMRTTNQGSWVVSHLALSALLHIDPDPESVRIGVIDAFRNKDIEHINLIMRGLSSMGTFPDPYPAINEMSLAGDEETRIKAITIFGKVHFGTDKSTLLKLLCDKSVNIRKATLEAMVDNGYYAKQAVIPLIKVLEKDSPELRALGAEALMRMPPYENVVQALIKALDDEYPPVRASSAAALGGFGAKASDALPKLYEMSENDMDLRARKIAKSAIEKIKAG